MFDKLLQLWRRLLFYARRTRFDRELDEEMRFHLELKAEENLAAGISAEEVRYMARRQFGNQTLLQEVSRDMWSFRSLETLVQDLRYGMRILIKQPGFTLIAILTLAFGIGANTAIFSVVNALMLRPLPFPHPERLVRVEEVSKRTNIAQEAWGGHFLDWQEHSQTLEGIAQIDFYTMSLTGEGDPERVEAGRISASFFPMLGAQPLPPGRNFTAAEDSPGGERVVILSHELWQRRYNGDQDVVGRSVTLNDANYTVIGVVPADFRFFYHFDVWVPLALDPQWELAMKPSYQPTVARLKSGVTPEQAQAEMDALLQHYETTRPEGRPRIDSRTRLVPLQEHFLGERKRPLLVLLGAVGLVLLIACANVANLLLARAAGREKELAIRGALGAGRLRLARQLLTECLLLAVAGGVAGLLLAYWLTSLLGSIISTDTLGELGRMVAVTIDLHVLGFTLLISLVTGLLFGLFPALRLSRTDLNVSLKQGGRGSLHGRGLRGALMMSEVALAVLLLVGAGLLIRSFAKLLDVDPGYRAENLLTARLSVPPRYRDNPQHVQFYEQILQRLVALPGVDSVGLTNNLPLTRYTLSGPLRVEGRAYQKDENPPSAPVTIVNSDYFRTMGISLRAGRIFNDGDAQGATRVAMLSESLARRLFPDEDPLGKRLLMADGRDSTVIGVACDIRYTGLDGESEQAVYLSYRQRPSYTTALVLRGAVEPSSLAPALRKAVREVDPALPVSDVMTMDARLFNSVAERRFNLLLLGGFAALALLLACVGVYGVISYGVTQRTREIGIRLALGAQANDVIRLIIRQGMRLVLAGVGIGLTGALALTRLMKTLLYDVSATDPLTFTVIALLLVLVALLACWIPARRAAKVDPMKVLRSE